jgi:hypothetical protein
VATAFLFLFCCCIAICWALKLIDFLIPEEESPPVESLDETMVFW